MPIYEYKCPDCGHQFEKIVKLNETPACPSCGNARVEKLLIFGAAVSTTKSRGKSIQQARARANAVKKEQDHAQAEYERNYIKDHS